MAKKRDLLSLFKPAQSSGELIKAFRINFEIRQEDMARACRINQSNLSAIESGSRPVGPSVALKLAAYMGLSPEIILYPSGYENEIEYNEVLERMGIVQAAPVEAAPHSNDNPDRTSDRSFPKTTDVKKIWAYIKKHRLEWEVLEYGGRDLEDLAKKTHKILRSPSKQYRKSTKKVLK